MISKICIVIDLNNLCNNLVNKQQQLQQPQQHQQQQQQYSGNISLCRQTIGTARLHPFSSKEASPICFQIFTDPLHKKLYGLVCWSCHKSYQGFLLDAQITSHGHQLELSSTKVRAPSAEMLGEMHKQLDSNKLALDDPTFAFCNEFHSAGKRGQGKKGGGQPKEKTQ